MEFEFWSLDLEIDNTHPLEKEHFNLELCNYQNTHEQNVEILQILENTLNTHKYITCIMQYFLCLEVFYLVLLFWIVFSCSSSVSVCVPILTNVPNLFNFQRIKFCSKPYMDMSLSLINLAIIICESALNMKDCNGEVLTWGIAKLLHLKFWKFNANSI